MAEKKRKGLPVKGACLMLFFVLALVLTGCRPGGEDAPAAAASTATPAPVQRPEGTVWALEGECSFPDEKEPVYHFTYRYPQIAGESYAALMVNDTYQMALDEMVQLVLPMFANEPAMRFDGRNEVTHDFEVTCNNGRFLSVLMKKSQSRGEEGVFRSLESLTFDMSGEYAGESLTLRGVVMVGDSTDQLAAALTPVLYQEFLRLQQAGVCRPDADEETFALEFSPAIHFYADEEGRVVFYFPPVLLAEPSFDVPTFPYTPAELESLL